MAESRDNPPTLASLRARRGKVSSAKRTGSPPTAEQPGQTGLPFSSSETASEEAVLSSLPAATSDQISPETHLPAAQLPGLKTGSRQEPRLPVERRIWSVRSLVSSIRQQVETIYTDLWVEGEISNCRPATSGHVYFTLKDGEAQLPVVLFRRQAQLLRFRPADGLAVLVRGRVSVYETRGQLQLIAETLEPRGAGALQLAFEQLKARLLAEGLFDADRKRALPAFPATVGVITSPTGAVVRDIVTVVRRRHARLNLLIYPATVQGPSCATSVAAGIRWFNAHPEKADLIIVARGGGSIEDLAGFNDERLARAIAASEIPIVSAIGHETDFTIADFVADLRTPTPSAAAELVTAAQHRIEERIAALSARVRRAGRFHLVDARQRYARLSSESVLARLRDGIDRREQRIDELALRLESSMARRLRGSVQRLQSLDERLRRQNISLRIANAYRRLETANVHLGRISTQTVAMRQTRLHRAAVRLETLSPLAVLSRGYALVYSAEGILLRSARETAPGQRIRARLAEGTLEAQITATKTPENSNS